jgi:hypothetical protein
VKFDPDYDGDKCCANKYNNINNIYNDDNYFNCNCEPFFPLEETECNNDEVLIKKEKQINSKYDSNNNIDNNMSNFTPSIVSTQPIITFQNNNSINIINNSNNENVDNTDFKTIENEITEFSVCMSDTLY